MAAEPAEEERRECAEGRAEPLPTDGVVWPVEECSICCERMGDACPTRRLSCGHGYHHSCIQRWLQRNASCPLCKAIAPQEELPAQPAPKFRIDMGHQEMVRVMQELEDIFRAIHECVGPDYPVAISGLGYNLCVSLGYEDEDELEEALGGPLADFLAALPHFEVDWPIPGEEADGAAPAAPEAAGEADAAPGAPEAASEGGEATSPVKSEGLGAGLVAGPTSTPGPKARMRPEPPDEEAPAGPGTRTTFTVSEPGDLWRVVLQGPRANVEIPEIEFAIRPQLHRRIDTIYNMITAAIFHLGDHVQKNSRAGSISDDEATKIVAAIDNLNQLLDLEQPFTWVMVDPSGVSELKPSDGVHVEPGVPPAVNETEPETADGAA